MRKLLLLFSVLLSMLIIVAAERAAAAQGSRKVVLVADLDGNGKSERIVKVEYKKPKQLPTAADRTKCQARAARFIKYVLYRDSRKSGVTIFDYFIGDDESQYWVYEIRRVADLNRDGLKDLVFYAGDDTTNEHVYLLQKPSYFKVVYMGVMGLDEYNLNKAREIVAEPYPFSNNPKVVAKWNPRREVFEGTQARWITDDCVSVRAEPSAESKVVRLLFAGDIVRVVDSDVTSSNRGKWQKIKIEDVEGWVNVRYLSKFSPTKQFAKG